MCITQRDWLEKKRALLGKDRSNGIQYNEWLDGGENVTGRGGLSDLK